MVPQFFQLRLEFSSFVVTFDIQINAAKFCFCEPPLALITEILHEFLQFLVSNSSNVSKFVFWEEIVIGLGTLSGLRAPTLSIAHF